MKNLIIFFLLLSKATFSQLDSKNNVFVSDKRVQALTFDFAFSSVKTNKLPTASALSVGLNLRTKNNWNYNLEYSDYLSNDLYPFIDGSYLLNDLSVRFGKLYRKGIWLYGVGVGPSYFLRSTVLNTNNLLSPRVLHETTIGLSTKANIIISPLSWLGIGVSYRYNLNMIQSTNMLWFSIYTGRVRFKLKKYKTNYNNL